MECQRVRGLNREGNTFEEEYTEDTDLNQTLTDDEFPHLISDEAFTLRVGLSFEQFITRRLSGKSERSKGIHDEVDPQHLNRVER